MTSINLVRSIKKGMVALNLACPNHSNKVESKDMALSPLSIPTGRIPKKGRKKVLFYYPDFGAMGGIERFIESVTSSLKTQANIQPIIICSKGTSFYERLEEKGFIEGVNLWGIKTLSIFKNPNFRVFDFISLAQLVLLLKKIKPHIVHVHIGQIENLFFKVLGYPVVYSFHGYGSLYSLKNTKNPLKRRIKKYLLRWLFKKTVSHLDALLFVSHSEQERMVEEGFLSPENPGQIVYNGLALKQLKKSVSHIDSEKSKELKVYFGVPINSRIISFINRMDENKNPLEFIELAEKLAVVFEDLYFVMAGTGPMDELIQNRLAVSPIQGRFRFVGYQKDVYPLIYISDLIIHVPNMEGFGLCVLESIALGTPCLAYAVGGINEILSFPAAEQLRVHPGNIEELTQKAIHLLLLDTKGQIELSQELIAHAAPFELDKTILNLEEIYTNVAHS